MQEQPKTHSRKLNISVLEEYSIGIVASNKDKENDITSPFIEVVPIEVRKFASGELTDNVQTITAEGNTPSGESYSATVDVTLSIKAKWLSIGNSNRLTPPNVRRNEKVMIYRLGEDDPEYFWDTLDNHIKLRRLETVVIAFSGEPSLDKDATLENENCYFLQVSTHTKNVLFHTSSSNGEPYEYDIQLDTGNGEFIVTDSDNNYLTLKSKERLWELGNGDGTFFRLNGPHIEYFAPGGMSGNVTENNSLEVGGSNTARVTGDNSLEAGGSSTIKSQGTNTIESPGNVNLNSSRIGLQGTTSSSNGDYGGDGSVEMSGDATFLQNVRIEGNLDVEGTTHTSYLTVDNIPWG